MIDAVLQSDPDRQVIATLRPKEQYSPVELAALEGLTRRNRRLSVRIGGMKVLLQTCDYIATQNSSVAFDGIFFSKPAVLFAKIDFHHISANVAELGSAMAGELGPDLKPDYAGYIHWFWQNMSINAGHPNAEQHIREALLRAGWPV